MQSLAEDGQRDREGRFSANKRCYVHAVLFSQNHPAWVWRMSLPLPRIHANKIPDGKRRIRADGLCSGLSSVPPPASDSKIKLCRADRASRLVLQCVERWQSGLTRTPGKRE